MKTIFNNDEGFKSFVDSVLLDKISKNIYEIEVIQNKGGGNASTADMLMSLSTAYKKRIASQYLVNESNKLLDDIASK